MRTPTKRPPARTARDAAAPPSPHASSHGTAASTSSGDVVGRDNRSTAAATASGVPAPRSTATAPTTSPPAAATSAAATCHPPATRAGVAPPASARQSGRVRKRERAGRSPRAPSREAVSVSHPACTGEGGAAARTASRASEMVATAAASCRVRGGSGVRGGRGAECLCARAAAAASAAAAAPSAQRAVTPGNRGNNSAPSRAAAPATRAVRAGAPVAGCGECDASGGGRGGRPRLVDTTPRQFSRLTGCSCHQRRHRARAGGDGAQHPRAPCAAHERGAPARRRGSVQPLPGRRARLPRPQ